MCSTSPASCTARRCEWSGCSACAMCRRFLPARRWWRSWSATGRRRGRASTGREAMTIRTRLIVIGALAAVSVFALVPRNVTQRVYDAGNGRMKDTTVRQVPISLGLDLRGGIHLALEVDESKGPVPDCADAIQRAERVVRTRIDEFGTREPVVQIQGRCRLIVELAGEKDPARAKSIIQRTAFLEFRITDMKNLFRDALPAIDKALERAGVRAPGQGAAAASVTQLFGTDTVKAKAKAQKG